MLVTLLGISIDDSLFIPKQHDAGMVSTSFPKTKDSTCEPKLPELLQFLAFHTTDVKLLQRVKALLPMLVTLLPIVTEVKPLHSAKAHSPMLVTLLGIVTEVKLLQLRKASSPMLVTLLGISREVKPLQPLKALLPMLVTLLPIVTEVKLRQL